MIAALRAMLAFSGAAGLFLSAAAAPRAAELMQSTEPACAWRIEGPLAAGDADRIAAALKGKPVAAGASAGKATAVSGVGRAATVCLNGAGGTWGEGAALMRHFRQSRRATYIGARDVCTGACAVAFMGGTVDAYAATTTLARTLALGGELAFTAPTYGAGSVGGEAASVETWTLQQVAATMRDLGQEIAGSKTPYFKASLIERILASAGVEPFAVDTVGKAIRFDIALAGYGESQMAEDAAFANICANLMIRAFDIEAPGAGAVNAPAPFARGDYGESVRLDASGNVVRTVEMWRIGEADGNETRCSIGLRDAQFSSEAFGRSAYASVAVNGRGLDAAWALPPATALTAEAVAAAVIAGGKTAEPLGADRGELTASSLWTAGDATLVLLRSDDGRRVLAYAVPGARAAADGVTAGAVLFDGKTGDGRRYTGAGFAVHKTCGPVRLPATGTVAADDQQIVLRIPPSPCAPRGTGTTELRLKNAGLARDSDALKALLVDGAP
jgi:hypothetical protein